ncbi:MAG: DUF2147 domain-containing protein [Bacteroidota bacterium]
MKRKMLIKQLTLIGLGIWVALISIKASAQTGGSKIEGKWYAKDLEKSIIEVTKTSDGTYEGVVKSSAKESYVGGKVIRYFTYDADKQLYKGKIYSLARGMELDGEIVLEKDGRLKLTGRKFFMTKTFYWTRSNDNE